MSEKNSVFQPPAEPAGTLSAENLETKDKALKSQARDLLRSLDADMGAKEP